MPLNLLQEVNKVKKEDLAHLKEEIDTLSDRYNFDPTKAIISLSTRIMQKRPSITKEIAIERAFSLIKAELGKAQSFSRFDFFMPIGTKVGDWNYWEIKEIRSAWIKGDLEEREKLVNEGKVMTDSDGNPVEKIIEHEIDEDGIFHVIKGKLVDPTNDNSVPIPRDYRKKIGKPPKEDEEDTRKNNRNYSYPMKHNYHMEVTGIVGIDGQDDVSPGMIQLRYYGDTADPTSENFLGPTMFSRQFNSFSLKARLSKEGDIPLYSGKKSIWDNQAVDKDVDMKIASAVSGLDNLVSCTLDELPLLYKELKRNYSTLLISEVTISSMFDPNPKTPWMGQKVILTDRSVGDKEIQGYFPYWIEVTPPKIPCRAMIVYRPKWQAKTWDSAAGRNIDEESYQAKISGVYFIESAVIDDEVLDELENLMKEME